MVTFDVDDTIVAIASAPGQAVRGIVRISGPQMAACLDSLFRPDDGIAIANRKDNAAITGQVPVFDDNHLKADVLVWPTERSFTRQPTAEIHTVGSTPILQQIVSFACKHGARLAKPGEFTLRAFLSGRIDLTQAEAVLAVIDAEGDRQLSTALHQLAGGLAGPLGKIRDDLMSILAELEAGLDFVEEDIEFISQSDLEHQLQDAFRQLKKIAEQISRRDVAVDGAKVVLTGLPNSGKSSLFNALTQTQNAIVTEIAGTTTDFNSARVELNSSAFELIDTAGFELTLNKPEEAVMGQAQTFRQQQQEQADLRLLCIDGSKELTAWDRQQISQAQTSTIVVVTKSDLVSTPVALLEGCPFPVVQTSVFDPASLMELRQQIGESLTASPASESVVGSTVMRAKDSLEEAQQCVQRALESSQQQFGEELVAAEIRQSLEGLGQVAGTVYTDDILDLVFGRFCIGK